MLQVVHDLADLDSIHVCPAAVKIKCTLQKKVLYYNKNKTWPFYLNFYLEQNWTDKKQFCQKKQAWLCKESLVWQIKWASSTLKEWWRRKGFCVQWHFHSSEFWHVMSTALTKENKGRGWNLEEQDMIGFFSYYCLIFNTTKWVFFFLILKKSIVLLFCFISLLRCAIGSFLYLV